MQNFEIDLVVKRIDSLQNTSTVLTRKSSVFQKKEGSDGEKFILNYSVSPALVSVPLALYTNIKYLYVEGKYIIDDLPNNIKAGDPAPLEVQIDGSAVWTQIDDHLSLGGAITSLDVRPVAATATRDVEVNIIVGAAG